MNVNRWGVNKELAVRGLQEELGTSSRSQMGCEQRARSQRLTGRARGHEFATYGESLHIGGLKWSSQKQLAVKDRDQEFAGRVRGKNSCKSSQKKSLRTRLGIRARARTSRFLLFQYIRVQCQTSIHSDIQLIQRAFKWDLYICKCYSNASFRLLRAEFGHIYIFTIKLMRIQKRTIYIYSSEW